LHHWGLSMLQVEEESEEEEVVPGEEEVSE
jgi:hypothetical protein